MLVGVTHGQHADRARRLTAMRIAVAVFDGMPRHIAETTAERLAIRMAIPPAPPGDAFGSDRFVLPRTGPRGVDPDETATLLATTPITVTRGEVPVSPARCPARPSPTATPAYLRRPALRVAQPLPAARPDDGWLADLSRDERQQVRFRAAQAAGLLCALDYTHTLDALVLPAANAGSDAADGESPRTPSGAGSSRPWRSTTWHGTSGCVASSGSNSGGGDVLMTRRCGGRPPTPTASTSVPAIPSTRSRSCGCSAHPGSRGPTRR